VQVPTTDGGWTTIANGQIYRISSPVFTGELLSIPLSSKLSSSIRVLIHNDNDVALRVENTATVNLQQVGILFKKDDSNVAGLTLLIGNSTTTTPSYEIQKTLSFFGDVTPTVVTLSDSRANPLFTPIEEYIPFGERYKYLINIGLMSL